MHVNEVVHCPVGESPFRSGIDPGGPWSRICQVGVRGDFIDCDEWGRWKQAASGAGRGARQVGKRPSGAGFGGARGRSCLTVFRRGPRKAARASRRGRGDTSVCGRCQPAGSPSPWAAGRVTRPPPRPRVRPPFSLMSVTGGCSLPRARARTSWL